MDAATAHAQLGTAATSFLASKHQLLIDGKWGEARSGKKFDVFDPATGQAIAVVAEAEAADAEQAVKAARRAFESGPWAKTSPADRCKLIWKLADLLETHADEIAEIAGCRRPRGTDSRRPWARPPDPAWPARLR